jgi:uncharacterized coiled-coil protein SlyX
MADDTTAIASRASTAIANLTTVDPATVLAGMRTRLQDIERQIIDHVARPPADPALLGPQTAGTAPQATTDAEWVGRLDALENMAGACRQVIEELSRRVNVDRQAVNARRAAELNDQHRQIAARATLRVGQ